jgi:hypothetical protein
MGERITGTVTAINPRSGRIAVEFPAGEHAVAEIITGASVAPGDAIEGTFPERGRTYWRTTVSDIPLQVYVWAVAVPLAGVRAMLAD